MKHELTFKSRARVVRALGDKLISGEVAAIIELVKNAYDADATNCHIEINPDKDLLTIKDDGHGMSLEDIQEKWTELGTENKFRNKKSRSGRTVLGEKGIGRLATAKLGRYLKIESTIKVDSEFKSVAIDNLDWDSFTDESDSYIEDIKFFVEEIEGGKSTGTILTISELNQYWTKDNIKALVFELRKLISPVLQKDIDFNIYLNLDAVTKDNSDCVGSEILNERQRQFLSEGKDDTPNKITPFPVLDACDYTFTAEYSNNHLSGELVINDTREKYPIEVKVDKDIPLGKGLVQLNIFDRDADSVKNTFIKSGYFNKNDKGKFPLREAREHLHNLSGIAIYRNEFRIRPYGNRDADWLELDKRRVQNPSKCLEQAQISGLILVDSADISGLIERSSREGFEHNENFLAFKNLLLKAIHEVELARKSYKSNLKKGKDNYTSTITVLLERMSTIKIHEFSDYVSDDKKEEFKKTVSEYKTTLDKLIGIIHERQAILEARSTLGFIFAEVIHEARHYTSAAGTKLILLTKKIKNEWNSNIPDSVSRELLKSIKDNIDLIKNLASLFKRLDPLLNVRKNKPHDFFVYEAVKKPILVFKERAETLGVSIEHNRLENLIKINGHEGDLSTAIINLLDNSLYWHQKKEIKNPYIKINYKDNDKSLLVFIEDNAGGVLEKYQDFIFNVGFTTKSDGSGLGLSIARESLGRTGANITHENTDDQSGSIFTIEIDKDI